MLMMHNPIGKVRDHRLNFKTLGEIKLTTELENSDHTNMCGRRPMTSKTVPLTDLADRCS